MNTKKKYEALVLLDLLEKASYEARLVGGCVRDELLGLPAKDYDIACTAKPDEIISLLKRQNIRHLTYGQEHGTITALMPHGPVEITTLREDVKTFGRKAQVSFHSNFEADAQRRDFTINALSENKYGEIFDYFEGRKHLAKRQIFFVGEARLRIKEDYLRILRFFRFKSRFHLKSDPKTLDAIKKEIKGLKNVSLERITSELLAIFQTKKITATLKEMSETQTLSFIFPQYKKLPPSRSLKIFRCVDALGSLSEEYRPLARIAVFLWFTHLAKGKEKRPSWSKIEFDDLVLLRLSAKDKQYIVHLLEACEQISTLKNTRADILMFVDKYEKHERKFLEHFIPFIKSVNKNSPSKIKKINRLIQIEKKFSHLRSPLNIDGRTIMEEFGVSQGKLVGELLHLLRISYLNGEWSTEQEAFAWLRKNVFL